MCSSPADSTPVPMGPLTTRDCAAISDPLTVRSEDSTDISAKGLLPQLIDLLHALTEAQEVLRRKVRDAGLEYTGRPAAVDGRWAQTEPSDSAVPGSFLGASPNAAVGIRRELPTDDVEVVAGRTSVGGFGNDPLPKPSIDASAAPVSATAPQATSPSSPPAVMATPAVTPADLSETSTRTDRLNSGMSGGETSTAPSNRDYNFFDELDARLADLQDPPGRPGDS
jgi:hypothetical protein